MSYIFDTSFLFALLYADDMLHEQAVQKMREIGLVDGYFFLNELVYYETTTILTYKLGANSIDLLDRFLDSIEANIIYSSRYEYRDFFRTVHKKMSIEDVATVYDCRKGGYTLLSFDKQQLSLLSKFL